MRFFGTDLRRSFADEGFALAPQSDGIEMMVEPRAVELCVRSPGCIVELAPTIRRLARLAASAGLEPP